MNVVGINEARALFGGLGRACARLWLAGLLACGCGGRSCEAGSTSAPSAASGSVATSICAELASTNPWEDRLGNRTLADRGRLLGCTHAATFTQAEVAKNLFFPPAIGPAANGYELFVIQYVSEGRPGVARAHTALLYLPSGGATDVPIVAVEHAASGVGPSCGPSHVPALVDPLAVPLVGRGYAVIAPDFAGMGVDNGMTSYFVGEAEAAATLDGVRALRQFHDPRFDAKQLGGDFFVAGHSQGGHAALFTHQLFDASIGVRLLGSIALAPGLGSARGWAAHLDNPSRRIGVMDTAVMMSLYAHMLYNGAPDPGSWLTPSAQATLPSMLHEQCLPTLVASVPARFPLLGDLYQPSFRAAAARCSFDGACPEFEPWASALVAEQPGNISSPIPSLILQGLADTVVPPTSVTCIARRMTARGTPIQACAYAGADHVNILAGAVPDMVRWIAARRAGSTLDVCPAPLVAACDAP